MEIALLALAFVRPSTMIGRLFHYALDAVLVSTTLAGIRRSTGLTFNTDEIKNDEIRKYTLKYLGLGEYLVDQTVAFMGASSYFKRNRGD